MPQKSVFTTITPLPLSITRNAAIAFLHDHARMITLNPLVLRHHPTHAPSHATDEESHRCTWYAITDRISYIPGLPGKTEVTYKAGFYDLPNGLQTHVFAPGGVDIRGHWTVGGNLPGEKREPVELGTKVPRDRLYLREHVVLRCNVFFTAFVKKNLKKSHAVVVQRMVAETLAEGREDGSPEPRDAGVQRRQQSHAQSSVSVGHDDEPAGSPGRHELDGGPFWPSNTRDDLDSRDMPAELDGGRRHSETDI